MDNNALKAAAQKELLRRAAKQELDRRSASTPVVNTAGKTDRERSWGDTLSDVGLSGAQGFLTGVEGLVGMPGDIQQLAGMGASWGAGKLGFSPEVQEGAKSLGLPQLPTAQDVGTFTESIIGPKYKPDTDVGRYVGSVAEMIPSAAAGPGNLIRKGAMAVLPGVAMEATKDVTGGNPIAEAAAGIGASLLAAGRGGDAIEAITNYATGRGGRGGTGEMFAGVEQFGKDYAKRTGQKDLKGIDASYAAVKTEADKTYDALRSAGIKYDQQTIDNAIADVSVMRTDPDLAPMANAYKRKIAQYQGKGMDFEDLDDLEQTATSLLRDMNVSENDKRLLVSMLSKVRSIRESGNITTSGVIPPSAVNDLVAKAKDYGRRNILARDIKGMEKKSKWYLGGEESGLRNKFASYGRSQGQNLKEAEEKAFLAVLNREGILSPVHTTGTRGGQFLSGLAGYGFGGPLGIIASLAGTAAARKFMEVYTKQGVEKAIKTVLAGVPAQERAAILDQLQKQQARTRAAISSTAAAQQSAPTEIDIPGGDLPTDQNAGGRVGRKSGGRINSPICSEVRRVRALLSEKTASMLSMPDDAVATALHIAKGK
jgi:hypothetical protein